jgi:hypothetical protein
MTRSLWIHSGRMPPTAPGTPVTPGMTTTSVGLAGGGGVMVRTHFVMNARVREARCCSMRRKGTQAVLR